MIKRIICTALVLLGALMSVSGQHYVGVKGGYGAAQGRFFPIPDKGGLIWNKYTGGVMWKYYSSQQVVGGVSAELEFQMRGYRIFDGNGIISDETSYTSTTRTVSSITMPLIWQPHLYMINRKVRVFLNAGVTFSYNLGIGDKLTNSKYGFDADGNRTITHETSPYVMQTARDVRWHCGWLGGFGVGVLIGRWEVFAEGRYYYGMSDILRTKTKYLFNEEESIRSELDNIYITMGVFFRLGKGDITEPPLRKRRPIPAGDDDFRNIKTGM